MVVAKTVLLLTQQVVFGKIIVKSSLQNLFINFFLSLCFIKWLVRVNL